MAEKLAESTWTSFTKKQKLDLDDASLRKALARWDKAPESDPQARLEALSEVVEQFKKQNLSLARRRKELGDKVFAAAKDQLNELLDEAEALQKKVHAAAQEDDSEADTPALLTSKMIPLLKELRKGETQMHALICTAGKNTAVLIMRKPIATTRRKLLATAVDATGGMKYIEADCVYEGTTLTFVVKSPGAQLAKRLRQALHDQTDLRLKVKVRGEDGVEEVDGEDESGPGEAEASPDTGPVPEPPSPERLAYEQRLRSLSDRLSQALRDGHPEATKMRALSGFASEKAAAGDYAGGIKALEMLQKLLAAPAGAPSGTEDAGAAFKARMTALVPQVKQAQESGLPAAAQAKLKLSEAGVLAGKRDFGRANALLDEAEQMLAGTAVPTGARQDAPSPGTGNVAFTRLKLQWNDAKRSVERDLEALQDTVIAEYDDADTAEAAQKILRVTGRFNEGLGDTLDDLYNAADAGLQSSLRSRAADIAARYLDYLANDELVAHVEINPFVPLDIRGRLSTPLQQLRQQLGA